MKFFLFLTAVFIYSCNSFEDDFTKIGKQTLKDGSTIEVLLNAGGATVSDVVWVKKTSNENENYIGKIKWHAMGGILFPLPK